MVRAYTIIASAILSIMLLFGTVVSDGAYAADITWNGAAPSPPTMDTSYT